MKNKFGILMLVAVLMCGVNLWAQNGGTVKGKCLDESGQPIVGAKVLYENLDNGSKVTLTTDKKGEFFGMGVTSGNYKVSLSSAQGQPIFTFNKVPVRLGENEPLIIDLKAERSRQGQGMSEEQKKQIEAAQKENQKIKGLNASLNQANDLRKAGNCDEAANVMTQATQVDATKDILWYSLAESLSCAKKYPEAIAAYQKAISIAPAKGEYHNNLGQAFLRNNQTEEAIAEYDKAAAADPANAGMYFFNEGAVLTNKGKADEAVKAFDKALAADPNKADAYYWKGVNMLAKATIAKDGKMEAPAGTAEAFNKYLELQPTGTYAQPSKEMLATIGAKVETNYGKAKGKK